LNQRGKDGCDHEHGKDDILHALSTTVGIEETEADEQATYAVLLDKRLVEFGSENILTDNSQHPLCQDVLGHPPVLLEDSVRDNPEL
jgi:hypothetical protein